MSRRPGRRLAALLTLAAAGLWCGVAAGAPQAPAAVLERLFREPIAADWFAPGFVSAVPAAQVQALIGDLLREHGPLQAVEPVDERNYTVHLERADVPAQITLDREGRVAGLFLQPPVPTRRTLEQQVRATAAGAPRAAVLVLTDGRVRAAHRAARPMAVGSAFKLAVLKVVEDQVLAGRLSWDQVVLLDPAWRSLPGGLLQEWPDDTPLTIATLANLMIALSDNTATDALMDLVGREALEAVSPRNRPFLTTRAFFIMRAEANRALRQAWLDGDEAARREVLERAAMLPLPDPAALTQAPTPALEWFFTAEELCDLLAETRQLQALQINPGPLDRRDWRSIAFKGGNEPGVLNLSSYVTAPDGARHCVVATWNSEAALDEPALAAAYRGLLRAVREAPSRGWFEGPP